jgi:haloalkane dehalogenase
MAYIDERTGPIGNTPEVFLCLHGQPTWSYLYRHMIPVLLNHTTLDSTPCRRIVAPDLIGFGRSDKPTDESWYTVDNHRKALLHLITTLNLSNITLVVQDWGGILGLTLPHEKPWRFKRLIVMNTTIGTGATPTKGFLDWRDFSNRSPDMKIGQLMKRSVKHLSATEAAAYDAPFPSAEYKAGVRRFPNLVPISKEMDGVSVSLEAAEFFRSTSRFEIEDVFMAVGMKDPVLGPQVMEKLARLFRNGCYYHEVSEGGHFTQEWGGEIARLAIEVFEGKGVVEGTAVRKVQALKEKL